MRWIVVLLLTGCTSTHTLGELFDECVAQPQEGWAYCNGFEKGLGTWDDRDTNPGATTAIISDPGPFDLEQNNVVRLAVSANARLADLVKVVEPPRSTIFLRWYAKWENNFPFDAVATRVGLFGALASLGADSAFGASVVPYAQSTVSADTFGLRLTYPGNPNCLADQSSCTAEMLPPLGTAPPELTTNQWYCIELMVDMGTPRGDQTEVSEVEPDGVVNFWVAGLQRGPRTGLWLRRDAAEGIGAVWFQAYRPDAENADSSAGVLIDNVVLSDTRVGCRPTPL